MMDWIVCNNLWNFYNQLSVRTATTPEYNTINPIITATISGEARKISAFALILKKS